MLHLPMPCRSAMRAPPDSAKAKTLHLSLIDMATTHKQKASFLSTIHLMKISYLTVTIE